MSLPNLLTAANEEGAVEALHELGCTDGLPVVVPTPERVDRMVLATGLDPDLVVGEMGPGGGAATVHRIAANAVMAGCLADHAPVVLAAIRAMCEPEFDLAEMQGTTHCTAPLVIVNGPAREACGAIASGFGALGPGHRANACIGRAIRLAMTNIGGARPGRSDMALLGHPGKFTYCLAEAEEASPFPPFHTSLGYPPEASVVTVVGAEAPHSVLHSPDGDDPRAADRLLDTFAAVIANQGSNNMHLGGGGAVTVVLNPDHAAVLADAGHDRASIRAALAERAAHPRRAMRALHPKMVPAGDDDELIHAVRDPANVLVIVSGAGGLYSMVMPSWCAGPHSNVAVHAGFEPNPFCEVP